MDKSNLYRFLRFWFPVFVYSGIIFYISSISRVEMPFSEIHFDKILHILEYIPFGYLLARAFKETDIKLTTGHIFNLIVLISFLYGMSDEVHQSYTAGRNMDVVDMFADATGGAIGAWSYIKYKMKI